MIIASLYVRRRCRSGTGDSKTQARLFKVWYILFHYWHFSLALKTPVVLHIQLEHGKQFCFCILRTKMVQMDKS